MEIKEKNYSELISELEKEVLKKLEKECLHQIGRYGSEETCKDEATSKACMNVIFNFLKTENIIDGYHLELENGKVMMDIYNKKNDLKVPSWMKGHGVCPDLPTLFLVSDENPNKKYILCTSDDKYQNTGGNAIERVAKNYNFFLNCLTDDVNINPYVVFVCGGSFLNENNEPKTYFWAKLLQTFKFTKGGKPNMFWSFDSEHSSDKSNWNQLYVQRERFNSKQKIEILLNVISESIDYYKTIL